MAFSLSIIPWFYLGGNQRQTTGAKNLSHSQTMNHYFVKTTHEDSLGSAYRASFLRLPDSAEDRAIYHFILRRDGVGVIGNLINNELCRMPHTHGIIRKDSH